MKKYILGLITGLIVAGVVGVSATILYQANEIGFTPDNPNWNVNNLEDALNDLYAKKGGNKTAVEVATITTANATYTMQNDGYITGSTTGTGGYAAVILFSGDWVHISENGYSRTVSIWAPKDTVVQTRNIGQYDLKIYEFQ